MGTVQDCINEGGITARLTKTDATTLHEIGGITGVTVCGLVKGSINKGDITIEGRGYIIGGIIGTIGVGIEIDTIENCTNEGNILATAVTTGVGYQEQVGGIAGTIGIGGQVIDSINKGEVKCVGRDSYVGGITGSNGNSVVWQFTPPKTYDGGGIIERCINEGKVIGTNNCLTGGLIGYSTGTTESNASGTTVGTAITNQSYNVGVVESTSANTIGYTGGLVGRVDSYTSLNNSFNAGKVTSGGTGSYAYTGGMVGYTSPSNSSTTNCYNIGEVTATGHTSLYTGALFGYRGSSLPVTNCYYYRKTANVPTVAVGSGTSAGIELTNAQANTQSSYTGWDFTSIWQKDAGFMPHLRGIAKPANINI